MGIGLLWRRAVLGAGLVCLLGGLAGTASAATSFDLETDTSLTLDGSVHSWAGIYRSVTYGGYQYFGYWDTETTGTVYLEVSRRRLSDDNVQTLRFDERGDNLEFLEATTDAHNAVGLGISPRDGRLHISWSLHNTDRVHRYLQSATGCMELTQENFTLANCRFVKRTFQAERALETEMTYPTYFNDNNWNLYFSYRYDASSRGDQVLNTYNNDGTWRLNGRIMLGHRDGRGTFDYPFDPDGAGPATEVTSRERGVYISQFVFDKNEPERLHVSWAWRENTAYGFAGQHGLHYAYSDDLGATWKSSAGRTIGTAGEDPITIVDRTDTQVASEPPGYMFYGSGLAVDSHNNPLISGFVSEVQTADVAHGRSRQAHWFRDTSGVWYQSYVEPAERATHTGTSDIMFDRGDNAYIVYGRDETGWSAWNEQIYNQRALPDGNLTWQGGEYLDIQLFSERTFIDSDYVNVPISTTGNNQVRVWMRNDTEAREVEVTWVTDESTGWEATRQQRFRFTPERTYTEYTFTITDADWTGTLRTLELSPAKGARRGSVSIDKIEIYNSTTRTVAKTWDFRRGFELYTAEATPTSNWLTWSLEPLLPGIGVPVSEGPWRIDRERYKESKIVNFPMAVTGEPGNKRLTVRQFDIGGDDEFKEWSFETDKIGWEVVARSVNEFEWVNDGGTKGIGGTIINEDPHIVSLNNLSVPIGTARTIHVRMKNTSASRTAAVLFITDSSRSYERNRGTQFPITANSGYTTYNIEMRGVRDWSSEQVLRQLRIDPSDDTTRTGSFKIDRIYID
jgi:hypothetical protein